LLRLGSILDRAVKYGWIDRNPARGARLKTRKHKSSWLTDATQIEALLDAAGELDRSARVDHRHVARRAVLAVLVFGGRGTGERPSLRWRAVTPTASRLFITDAKTAAGVRRVRILPVLHDELVALKASSPRTGPDDLVFGTARGEKTNPSNVR